MGMKAPARSGKMATESNLQLAFMANARCEDISSSYGSRTRYDGSQRPEGGRHGGIDLSLPAGTPLLALADGTVINGGQGYQMEGFYIWLQHSPEDTGPSYWVYSKYQHRQSASGLSVGSRVKAADITGYSGNSGTTGGHFGVDGYPHLHLSTFKSLGSKYKVKGSRLKIPDSTLFDPLWAYHEAMASFDRLSESSLAGENQVVVSYVTKDGQVHPQGARVVWPVYCQPG